MIIPLGAELRFNQPPYISYAIIILCVIVFYFQATNYGDIEDASVEYCKSIQTQRTVLNRHDLLTHDYERCMNTLVSLHAYSVNGDPEQLEELLGEMKDKRFTDEENTLIVDHIRQHYEDYSLVVPEVLDYNLMYYPDSWNPWKMITSSLSHADFEHIFFNLLFFLAFAPGVEILVNNRLRFIAICLGIMFSTSVAYSLSIIMAGDEPIPSLGLSGVVMGMIGLGAYLMPRARIRVLFWFFIFIKIFYIPVWILAAWYIGWDTLDMLSGADSGGVNLVAHVSGGFSGYLIGMLWLRQRRDEVKGELEDEIEDIAAERNSNNPLQYSGGRRAFQNYQMQKEFKKNNDEFMEKLHRYVRTHQDSQAQALILDDYEMKSSSPEIYEELFERVQEWGPSRTLLCIGRLIINLYIQQSKYARALHYAQKCLAISAEFVLADSKNLVLLATMAKDSGEFELAYGLVSRADERYGRDNETGYNLIDCRILEIELMWKHLGKADEARQLMREYLAPGQSKPHPQLLRLAHSLISS